MSAAARIAAIALAVTAAPAHAQAPGAAVADLSGVALSLAFIVGLILVGAFVLKRTQLGVGTRSSGPLKVVAALPLGPRERLLLVEARGVEMLIAVSPAGVFNVGRASAGQAAPAEHEEPAFGFGVPR